MAVLIENEIATTVKRSLVYQATHNGEGNALPYMNRSFISFTFGGKKIEEFNLIATISGDRLNRKGYAEFEDVITTYDNLDGQHYWATHYKANLMDFTLSTDGIDLRMLDEFLYWFKAGVTRELILAEHPNRAIMARVSAAPVLNLLPFEQDIDIIISSEPYTTKTTLYKGDISLSLIMDEPHWYAKTNILGKKTEKAGRWRYEDVWDDVTTNLEVSIFASLDALKVLYEDGIPLGSMIEKNMLLGNGAFASVERQIISCIWSLTEEDENYLTAGEGAKIDSGDGLNGIIAGAIVDATENGIESLAANTSGYFFYSGTAPSPTVITFTLTPTIDENGYIDAINNTYTNPSKPYNEFIIESVNKQILKFTTPNIFTSYNKVIQVFNTYINSNNNWEKIRTVLRDTIRHPKVRAYAISIINTAQENAADDVVISATVSDMVTEMKKFFIGAGSTLESATFEFNSKTGLAIGTFGYYEDGATLSSDLEEDVGDMLRSNYIIILDRNYPTANGKIECWLGTNLTTKLYSHRITHDVAVGLSNIQIRYKNMYL